MTIRTTRRGGSAMPPTFGVWAVVLFLGVANPAPAAQADPGRLFFTPAQRAQLEAARARNVTQAGPGRQTASSSAPAPLRYDGLVIRSDGQTTRWVNGRPQAGTIPLQGLKPGQIRADGRIYEPYQVLRPTARTPAKPDSEDTAP